MVMVSLACICFVLYWKLLPSLCLTYNFMTKLVLCRVEFVNRGGIGYLCLRKNIGMSTTPVPLHVYQHSILTNCSLMLFTVLSHNPLLLKVFPS